MTRIHVPIDYQQKRKAAYPAIGDQLDALWKALSGKELPPEAAAIAEQIKAVKAQYPKASK